MSIDSQCPAERLAREAADVLAATWKAEAAGHREAQDDLYERLQAIETAASFVRASSSLGAFYLALLLFADADEQTICVHDSPEARQRERRMQRFAASIAGYLEGAADAATVETLRSYYLDRELERSNLRAALLDTH